MKQRLLIPILLLALMGMPVATAGGLGDTATPGGAAGGQQAAEEAPQRAAGGTAEAVVFYALAAVVAGAAIGCAVSTNIVRMAVCLFGTLGGVALLYFLMAANFLGAIQLIVYAGGTLIVIVFGVMLTSRAYGVKLRPRRAEVVAGAVVCVGLLVGLVTLLTGTNWSAEADASAAGGADSAVVAAEAPESTKVGSIGQALLTTYLVPFEVASVLLLAVMIGAAYLAEPERGRESRES
ncbi:MAG: NADH-quinone oxidoreductase subunit J [Planctomycetota bacterium]